MRDIDVLLIGTPNMDVLVGDYAALPGAGEEVRVDKIGLSGGGGAMITAIWLARLRLAPYLLCALSDDLFARYLCDELEREGVRTQRRPTSNSTGISIVLDARRDRRFITYDGSVNDISPAAAGEELLCRARHVHLANFRGTEDYDEHVRFIDDAHACGATVSLDMCWDESGRWDPCALELAKKLDVFFSNETEIRHYLQERDMEKNLRTLAAMGINTAVKLGDRGSAGVMGGQAARVPPVPVSAVDTTGAGDAFNAGFLYSYLGGENLETCLQTGNTCGALSVLGHGGYPASVGFGEFGEVFEQSYR